MQRDFVGNLSPPPIVIYCVKTVTRMNVKKYGKKFEKSPLSLLSSGGSVTCSSTSCELLLKKMEVKLVLSNCYKWRVRGIVAFAVTISCTVEDSDRVGSYWVIVLTEIEARWSTEGWQNVDELLDYTTKFVVTKSYVTDLKWSTKFPSKLRWLLHVSS